MPRGQHGMSSSPEFWAWVNLIERCTKPQHPSFKHYGGRGITVCEEWRNSFKSFFSHVGLRLSPKHSIDRIKNDLGYQPGNVRWATKKEQAHNSRWNHWIEIDGVTKLITEWAIEKDIHFTTIVHRIERGMSERDAVMIPARFGGRRASKKVPCVV